MADFVNCGTMRENFVEFSAKILRFYFYCINVLRAKEGFMEVVMRKILAVAELKGLAYNREAKQFIRKEIGAEVYSPGYICHKDIGEIALSLGIDFSQIIFFGTYSWRDLEALRKIREKKGVAIAFNKSDLIDIAPAALRTKSAWPLALLIAVFAKWHSQGVFEAISMGRSYYSIQHLMLPLAWEEKIAAGLAKNESFFHWWMCN